MYRDINEILNKVQAWAAKHQVNPGEIIVVGGSAMVGYRLLESTADIDIEVSDETIARLSDHAVKTPIPGTDVVSHRYPEFDIEHIDKNLKRKSDPIGYFQIATPWQLEYDYRSFKNPKYDDRLEVLKKARHAREKQFRDAVVGMGLGM